MRRAARTDANQKEIVNALRRVGATVHDTSRLGEGFPDIVAGYRSINYFLEVKDGSKPPSQKKLTEAEAKWHSEWSGQSAVVESVDEALRVIGAIK